MIDQSIDWKIFGNYLHFVVSASQLYEFTLFIVSIIWLFLALILQNNVAGTNSWLISEMIDQKKKF